jgi:uncharacterized glyoxalase superfamily protein PhnB
MSDTPIPAEAKRLESGSLDGLSLEASLTVNDVEKSAVWYQLVGFAVDRRFERDGKLMAVALKAGGARILIVQDDGAKGWDRAKGEGTSLQITTKQSIDELARGIKERGGLLALEPTDMRWGQRAFRLVDPDGYRLTISSGIPA